MHEFKFACPVCGQHITAAAAASGGQVDCPTCFRKIIVPQAPASEDTKFILSATTAPGTTPTSVQKAVQRHQRPSRNTWSVLSASGLLLLSGLATLLLLVNRDYFLGSSPNEADQAFPLESTTPTNVADSGWNLDLSSVSIPGGPVSGVLHGRSFVCQQTVLQGGNLTLSQGGTWPPELGLTISFRVQESEKFYGKSLEVAPDRAPPLPKVTLRWKNDQQQGVTRIIRTGYALRLKFGTPLQERLPGQIYLALPDPERSVVAGSFEAEIRRPSHETRR
jgi:hypothetical protein